jgi:hypothetical protein
VPALARPEVPPAPPLLPETLEPRDGGGAAPPADAGDEAPQAALDEEAPEDPEWDEDAGLPAAWLGRVLAPSGQPLTGLMVTVDVGELGARQEVEDGGFHFRRLRAGRRDVSVGIYEISGHENHFEYVPSEWGDRVVFFPDVELRPGETLEKDLRLPPGLDVSGILVGPDGGVLPERFLKLSPPGAQFERGIEQGSIRVMTDPEGRFVFHHVPPGEWYLSFGGNHHHFSTPVTRKQVNAGELGVVFRVKSTL